MRFPSPLKKGQVCNCTRNTRIIQNFLCLCCFVERKTDWLWKEEILQVWHLLKWSSCTGSHFNVCLAGHAYPWIMTSTFSKELLWLLFLQIPSHRYSLLKHVLCIRLIALGCPNLFFISNMKIFCLIQTQVLKLNWNSSSEEKSHLSRFLDSSTKAVAKTTSNIERMLRGTMPSVWETGITAFLGMGSISFLQKLTRKGTYVWHTRL